MRESDELLGEVRRAISEVGEFQLSEWRRRSSIGRRGQGSWVEEKSAKELVSFVDRESESRLSLALKAMIPGSSFYGEEGEKARGALTWVVDPLDGTTNYICGLDWFCVSVALFECRVGEVPRPRLGVVHRPSAGEWYWATRGGGAWEETAQGGTRRLQAAAPSSLSASLVCTGTPYRSPDTSSAFYAAAAAVTAAALDLRRMGSAALELCQVAAGRLQAFWELDLQPYDLGAALLVLEECGCPVTTLAGEPYRPFESRSIVTGVPGSAEQLRALVAPFYAESMRS